MTSAWRPLPAVGARSGLSRSWCVPAGSILHSSRNALGAAAGWRPCPPLSRPSAAGSVLLRNSSFPMAVLVRPPGGIQPPPGGTLRSFGEGRAGQTPWANAQLPLLRPELASACFRPDSNQHLPLAGALCALELRKRPPPAPVGACALADAHHPRCRRKVGDLAVTRGARGKEKTGGDPGGSSSAVEESNLRLRPPAAGVLTGSARSRYSGAPATCCLQYPPRRAVVRTAEVGSGGIEPPVRVHEPWRACCGLAPARAQMGHAGDRDTAGPTVARPGSPRRYRDADPSRRSGNRTRPPTHRAGCLQQTPPRPVGHGSS